MYKKRIHYITVSFKYNVYVDSRRVIIFLINVGNASYFDNSSDPFIVVSILNIS